MRKNIINHLEEAYHFFNKEFDAGLSDVVFTTVPGTESNLMQGWFVNHCWTKGNKKYHEININPEFLNEPIENIIDTILHEMAHVMDFDTAGDITRGELHGKTFKACAEKLGLVATYNKEQKDYSDTSLGKGALAAIEKYKKEFLKNKNPFVIFRTPDKNAV